MRIDFISDIACPWCAVGLHALERALERIGDEFVVDLHFEPFELNPALGSEGIETVPYLAAKYGLTPAQIEQNQATIRARGAAVGFAFGVRERVWNTFDAHRLLCWAGEQRRQRAFKHALLRAYHGEGRNPSAPAVLVELAAEAGLDPQRAAAILASDAYADSVREREAFWQQRGIHAVPSLVVDRTRLIQGAQPPEVLEQALRQIAAGQA